MHFKIQTENSSSLPPTEHQANHYYTYIALPVLHFNEPNKKNRNMLIFTREIESFDVILNKKKNYYHTL